jgi:hypothetical protein
VQLDNVRSEIKRMPHPGGKAAPRDPRSSTGRDSIGLAEILHQRMLDKIDGLCAERDKLKADQKHLMKGKALGGRQW